MIDKGQRRRPIVATPAFLSPWFHRTKRIDHKKRFQVFPPQSSASNPKNLLKETTNDSLHTRPFAECLHNLSNVCLLFKMAPLLCLLQPTFAPWNTPTTGVRTLETVEAAVLLVSAIPAPYAVGVGATVRVAGMLQQLIFSLRKQQSRYCVFIHTHEINRSQLW